MVCEGHGRGTLGHHGKCGMCPTSGPAVFLTRSAGPFRWPWRRIGSGLNRACGRGRPSGRCGNHRYIQPQGFPRRRTFQVRTARSIAGCFPYLRVRCTSRRSDGRHAQTGQLQTPSAAYHERGNRAFARLAPSAVRTEIVRNGRLIPVICNTANHTVGAINAQSVNNR